MRVFNVGIIGYGGFGKFLHNSWSSLEQIRVAAIADRNEHKLEGLQGITPFTRWEDLLAEKDIDIIAIVTEPLTHEMIATACMEAGKHVLIEKPLATSLAAANKIIQVRDTTKTFAAIDFIMRFNPLLQEIKRLTDQQVFGKLRRVDVENYAQDEQLPVDHWFWDPARSGGILIEHAVHFIDLVHFLSPSKPISINGLKHDRNPQQEDQVMANVLYEDGLIATHYHSFARPGFFEATSIKLGYDLADLILYGWIPLQAELKVLVNEQSKRDLLDCRYFTPGDSSSVENITDESRPKGWGISTTTQDDQDSNGTGKHIHSGGLDYVVNEMITGRFEIGQSKQEVYSNCVQSSLLDLAKKIENNNHQLIASLDAGVDSLEVAIRATESARG